MLFLALQACAEKMLERARFAASRMRCKVTTFSETVQENVHKLAFLSLNSLILLHLRFAFLHLCTFALSLFLVSHGFLLFAKNKFIYFSFFFFNKYIIYIDNI